MDNSHNQLINTQSTQNTIQHLSNSFDIAITNAKDVIGNDATRTVHDNRVTKTTLYEYQVEFSYLLNVIKSCPIKNLSTHINSANKLISEIEALNN